MNELKDAFSTWRSTADAMSFNVIKNYFGQLSDILRYVFDLSLQTGIFPDLLKIAKMTPVFKTGDYNEISNYRPVSFLPCFSKILGRTRHNCFYNYLVSEKIFEAVRVPEKAIPQSIPLLN